MNLLRRNLVQQITCKYLLNQNGFSQQIQKNSYYLHRNDSLIANVKCSNYACRRNPLNIIPRRLYASYEEPKVKSLTWKEKFLDLIGWGKYSKRTMNGKAVFLYECVADHVMYNEFVSKFNLPNTFNSWFLVTELHVWMLMVRAMGEIEHGEVVRNRIVESMWADVVKRVQKLVPGSRSLAYKQIEECSREFQYAILAYDEGLMKDDKQLASAIWKRFFASNNDNYENIELLIKYIRMNILYLDQLSREEFLDIRVITWKSLKEAEND